MNTYDITVKNLLLEIENYKSYIIETNIINNKMEQQKDEEIRKLNLIVDEQKAEIEEKNKYIEWAVGKIDIFSKLERGFSNEISELHAQNTAKSIEFGLLREEMKSQTKLFNEKIYVLNKENETLRKREEQSDYAALGKTKKLEEQNEKLKRQLNERGSDQVYRVKVNKMLVQCQEIIGLIGMKLNNFSIPNSTDPEIVSQKYKNWLELFIEKLNVIVETAKEKLEYEEFDNIQRQFEQQIINLERKIEHLESPLNQQNCALCEDVLKFPQCTKCHHFYHGECIYRAFLDKNSSACPFCTNKTVALHNCHQIN